MRKKLCLTCAQALQKRADIRYTGKRTRMDMCSGCHSKMLVTEYIVPDEPVLNTETGAEICCCAVQAGRKADYDCCSR